MQHFQFNLPLENPVLIFSLLLFIILFAPIILNKLSIPPIIGLLIAGAVIGPYGFNLMNRDASIVLYGSVGLHYIMFLAGLEIDLAEFNKNKYRSLWFGILTFSIPMLLGTAMSYYFLKMSILPSILLASMFASHTLIAYPIASRLGITKNKSVNITVGGTMITDVAALLVLAVIIGMVKGEVGQEFWITLGVSLLIFSIIVLVIFPIGTKWFFKKQEDHISQYIFVLAVLFLSAFMAELAGVEGIIGAFMAGLALNRLIPHTSALMNRIEFVGNALFIPIFLIGVGMLINFRIFFQGPNALIVAAAMTITATVSKYAAAYLSKLSFKFSKDEFMMMFGLSNAQAAATLAAVTIGYKIIIGQNADGSEIHLLSEDVLNGTIIMILFTCTISSFAVGRAAKRIAALEAEPITENTNESSDHNRVLIPISKPELAETLINFAGMIHSKKEKTDYFSVYVITPDDVEALGNKSLEMIQKSGSSIDRNVEIIARHDLNAINGILYSIKEVKATELVMGMHRKKGFTDTHSGYILEQVIHETEISVILTRFTMPVNLIQKIHIVVPLNAQFERGFVNWLKRIHRLSTELKKTVTFYCNEDTFEKIQMIFKALDHNLAYDYYLFTRFDDFLILNSIVKRNDLLVFVSARRQSLSYNRSMEKIPNWLATYFNERNVVVIYPEQNPVIEVNRRRLDGSLNEMIAENAERVEKAVKGLKRVFRV